MKNNKGFTLIELIVTMAIIASVMLISVPNVVSMVDKNRRLNYVNDAKKLVTLAKYKFNSLGASNKPASGGYVEYKLSQLDRSNLQEGPRGGSYDLNYSYVRITYDASTSTYIYYVQLVEQYGDDVKNANNKKSNRKKTYYRGIQCTSSTNLDKESAKMKYVKGPYNSLTNFTNISSCTTANSVK